MQEQYSLKSTGPDDMAVRIGHIHPSLTCGDWKIHQATRNRFQFATERPVPIAEQSKVQIKRRGSPHVQLYSTIPSERYGRSKAVRMIETGRGVDCSKNLCLKCSTSSPNIRLSTHEVAVADFLLMTLQPQQQRSCGPVVRGS
jgi:hypothetical protein